MNFKIRLSLVATVICVLSIVLYIAISTSKTTSISDRQSREATQMITNGSAPNSTSPELRNYLDTGPSAHTSRESIQPTEPSTAVRAVHTAGKFIGKWVLDESGSEGLPAAMKQAMTVRESDGVMHVQTIVNTPEKGEQTVSDAYVLNGRENQFAEKLYGTGIVRGTRVANLTNEGNGIEVLENATIESPSASMKVKIRRTWMITGNNSLVIAMDIQGGKVIKRNKRQFIKA